MSDKLQRFAGVYPSGKSHWQYRISLPKDTDGKRRQEVRGGYRTAEDAFEARRRRLIELGLGDDVPDDRMTLGRWLDAFLESHALNVDASTIYNYQGRKAYITPLLDVRLRDLTVLRVQRWVDAVAREKSPSRARDARQLLVMALNEAVRQRLMPVNVAHLSRAPRHEPKKRTILTNGEHDRQIDRFVESAERDHFAAAWLLMLMCQLRPGEISGLHWRDVNLDRATVAITTTRTRNATGQWVIGDGPKTTSSRRVIEMPERCVRLLREHRARQNERRLKAPPGWWDEQDLVFPNARGGILSNDVIDYRLEQLCKRADVPRITPHSLRATGATWARSLGEDAEVVQRRLGHKKIETTLGMYSLERPGESRETSDRLERALKRRPG